MATVGEVLREARTQKKLTLADIEEKTKIRVSYLQSLEEGNYSALPSSAYVQGFVKNYAKTLDLPIDRLLAQLRRELKEFSPSVRLTGVLPRSVDRDVSQKSIRVTGFFILGIVIFIGLSSYFLIQYRGFLGNPVLTVEIPHDKAMIRDQVVTVSGKTEPDATIRVNGELVEVAKDGSFQTRLTVFKGPFTVTVVATNRFGRETHVLRTVSVE